MAAQIGPITYTQGAGVGQGYFSSFALNQTAVVTVTATTGAVTLVIQRYGEATVSIPVPAGTTSAVEVNNIQSVGILAGAAPVTGTLTIQVLEV